MSLGKLLKMGYKRAGKGKLKRPDGKVVSEARAVASASRGGFGGKTRTFSERGRTVTRSRPKGSPPTAKDIKETKAAHDAAKKRLAKKAKKANRANTKKSVQKRAADEARARSSQIRGLDKRIAKAQKSLAKKKGGARSRAIKSIESMKATRSAAVKRRNELLRVAGQGR